MEYKIISTKLYSVHLLCEYSKRFIQPAVKCIWYGRWNVLKDCRVCADSPLAYMDPLSTNLTHMFCELYQDALTEYTYAAELAGLAYNITNTIYGLMVSCCRLSLTKKVKVAHTRLPSVGFRSRSRSLAVSLQVT